MARNKVPSWDQIPSLVQDDFRNANFEAWYNDRRNSDKRRLTLINAYLKLKPLGLWEFVNGPRSTTPQDMSKPGELEFRTNKLGEFLLVLKQSGRFKDVPEHGRGEWMTREDIDKLSIHFKHFDGWNSNEIAVHVDPTGLGGPRTWFLHAWEKIWKSYQNVGEIHKELLERGYQLEPKHDNSGAKALSRLAVSPYGVAQRRVNSGVLIHFLPDKYIPPDKKKKVPDLDYDGQVTLVDAQIKNAKYTLFLDKEQKVRSYTYSPMILPIQRQYRAGAKLDKPVEWPKEKKPLMVPQYFYKLGQFYRKMDTPDKPLPVPFDSRLDTHQNEHLKDFAYYVENHPPPEFRAETGIAKKEFLDRISKHEQDMRNWGNRLREHLDWADKNIDKGISWKSIPPTPREMRELANNIR